MRVLGEIPYIGGACEAINKHPEITDVETADSTQKVLHHVSTDTTANRWRRLGKGTGDVRPRSDNG